MKNHTESLITDEALQKMIATYVNGQMDLIQPEKMGGYDYQFSKKFNKKIKRLFWSEKYFGSHIKTGYAIRRVAIIIMVIGSIFIAGGVSAKVFGFRPWEYFMTYRDDVKMEDKTYGKPVQPKEGQREVTKVIPSYVPEGYIQNDRQSIEGCEYVDWLKGKKSGIQYSRVEIVESMSSLTDGEYTSKRRFELAGYEAYIYEKGKNECWISWDDITYHHYLFMINGTNMPEKLRKMAESLYE